jgi:hypothetical protein
MVQKRSGILLCGLLFCLNVWGEGKGKIDLEPANAGIILDFIPKSEKSHAMFGVSGDIVGIFAAFRSQKYDDALKGTTSIYSTEFSDKNGKKYVANYTTMTPYELQLEGPDNHLSFRRIDGTTFQEEPKHISAIPLNHEELQSIFEAGNLEEYFANRGMTMVPVIDFSAIEHMLSLLGLKAATSGLSEDKIAKVRALQEEKERILDAGILGKLDEVYSENTGRSVSFFRVTMKGAWTEYLKVEKQLTLQRYADSQKQKEFLGLWGISIDGKEFVFFQKSEQAYKFKGFRKAIVPLEGEKSFHKVMIPIYSIGWDDKETREIPEEKLCVLYKCEQNDASRENGLFCINKGYGKDKGTYTLRQCQKTTTTLKAVRIQPNGDEVIVDKTSARYSLEGPVLKSDENGKWQMLGISYGGVNLPTWTGTLPKGCHRYISETKAAKD